MNPLIQLKKVPVFLVALACFKLLSGAQAVVPPPDGGYPNFTTAEGDHALQALTTGVGNTAIGTFSLFSVTTGSFNTAVGAGSLDLNTADSNTATGAAALLFNTTGINNTANGTAALEFNDSGSHNVAVGAFALFNNSQGVQNTAIGADALGNNTTGDNNTAIGVSALFENDIGSSNIAIGLLALRNNTGGSENTALGFHTLINNTTGNSNTAIGEDAGFNQTIGNNNVYVGSGMFGVAGENSACYIASIFGQISATGVPVIINSNNKLGTNPSSKRFKEGIKPMDKASDALFALEPVIFRYKKEFDPDCIQQFGLVAEDVEKVNPDLVVRDKEGKPYSVRYDQVNAMLLNEFLKEHKKSEQQDRKIEELRATVARLEAALKEQATQIQKVSAQTKMNAIAPQMAISSR
jgi:hypothetical protein